MRIIWKHITDTARLMIGIGDYARYVQHMRECHPGQTPLSEAAYVRQRMLSHYPTSGEIKRCPC